MPQFEVVFPCQNPDCLRTFSSSKGMKSHLRQAKSCSWYLAAGKLPEGTPAQVLVESGEAEDMDVPDNVRLVSQDDESDSEEDGEEVEDGEEEGEAEDTGEEEDPGEVFRELLEKSELFHFEEILTIPQLGEAGPGPSTSAGRLRMDKMLGAKRRMLDDEDDERVEEEHTTAGKVLRMDPSLHERWAKAFASSTDLDGDVEMEGVEGSRASTYYPFASELDWRVAKWMVEEGIGHNSFDRLLAIPGVKDKLGISFSNTRSLHQAVESIPGRAGKWRTKRFSFPDRPDDKFILRHRDVLEAIQSLWGDPSLAEHLVYRPKRIFSDAQKKSRVYGEMWTGEWWSYIQARLPDTSHTIAPLIIATDKTQLTQFLGSRQAYPVYLTLGNIPNHLRRKPSEQAAILLAYLPVDKIYKGRLSKKEVSARHQRLFHAAMKHLMEPLVSAGKDGIEMISGDGAVRMVHPILASYVADYPEQCMVSCAKYGTCPKCQAPAEDLHSPFPSPPRTGAHTLSVMQDAESTTDSFGKYFESCMAEEVSGYVSRPFWEDLPFSDIHLSITPDVLHQLYQGVLKHLIAWCQTLLTKEELDRRIRALPRALGLKAFKNGISSLSQISGTERKNMAKILLGCLVGTRMADQGLTACRALLDFIYLAQYSTHDDASLGYMDDALKLWQDNSQYFIHTGIRDHLNIPKFHSLSHYVSSIRFLGTANNFNTEMFERLHIDFAKKGWRSSNKRDEFPQMTKWILRQENIHSFDRYIHWKASKQATPAVPSKMDVSLPASKVDVSSGASKRDDVSSRASKTGDVLSRASKTGDVSSRASKTGDVSSRASKTDNVSSRALKSSLKAPSIFLPHFPTAPQKLLSAIEKQHRVPFFSLRLRQYLNALGKEKLKSPLHYDSLPFSRVDTYYSFKFALEGLDDGPAEHDVIKASPLEGARFDTVIVLTGDDAESTGLDGTRVARIRVIFKVPSGIKLSGSIYATPTHWPKEPLAYVEWFKPATLSSRAQRTHNMSSVSKAYLADGTAAWSIIPLSNIRQSCMLFPNYSKYLQNEAWDTKGDVLDKVEHFLVNNWLSLYTYKTIYKV